MIAAVNAITIPTPTAIAVSSMCSISRGSNRELKLSKNQVAQNCLFWMMQFDAWPNVGMTGPPAARTRFTTRALLGRAAAWAGAASAGPSCGAMSCVIASIRMLPTGCSSSSTTSIRVVPSASISDSA